MPIKKDTTKQVKVAMPKEQAEAIAKAAAKEGVSVSAYIAKRIRK